MLWKKNIWLLIVICPTVIQKHSKSAASEKDSCRFDEAVAMQQSLVCAR